MKKVTVTRREFVRTLGVFAIAPVAAPFFTAKSGSKTVKCPICGKETSKTTIDWQGMCNSCNKNREDANKLRDEATSSKSDKNTTKKKTTKNKTTKNKTTKNKTTKKTTSGGSSSSSKTKTKKCPICGKETSKTTIDWQGMCNSCYSDYKYLKELEKSAK